MKSKMVNLVWILRLGKNRGVDGLQTENKMKKKKKKEILEALGYWF